MKPDSANRAPQMLVLLKLVHVAVLVSLLWKIRFFIWLFSADLEFPVSDPFFPQLLQSLRVLVAAYVAAVVSSVATLMVRDRKFLFLTGLIGLASLSILSIHLRTFNDVTFVCCAWVSLWCLWLVTRLGERFDSLYPRAVWLSHVILSLIFFGGTIGKITPGYWSGEVLYEIYFRDRDFWTYNFIRDRVSEESLRSIAMWHSRMVLTFEAICCFLWLMPRKLASALAIVVLCGIALTNNVLLFSVVSSLIGLAIVGLHDPSKREANDNEVH